MERRCRRCQSSREHFYPDRSSGDLLRDGDLCADTYSNSDSNTDSNAYTHAHAYTYTDAYSNSNSNADSSADSNAYPDANADTNAYPNADTYAYPDSDTNADTGTNSDPHANTRAYSDSDATDGDTGSVEPAADRDGRGRAARVRVDQETAADPVVGRTRRCCCLPAARRFPNSNVYANRGVVPNHRPHRFSHQRPTPRSLKVAPAIAAPVRAPDTSRRTMSTDRCISKSGLCVR